MSRKAALLAIVSIISLIAIASLACAAEYVVRISPETQNIKLDGVARYDLTIKNNMDEDQYFEIYSPDVQWDVSTDPVKDRLMLVRAGQEETTTLVVSPLYVNPGLYGVPVYVRATGKNMLIRSYAEVGVYDVAPPTDEYLPAIRAVVEMDESVDPREPVEIEIAFNNQNNRNIEKLDVRFRSNVINYDYETSLKPLEKRVDNIEIEIDPITSPQEDVLRVTMFTTAGEKTYQFELMPVTYEIISYGGLVEDVESTKKFFKTTKKIALTNDGNGAVTAPYLLEGGFFARIFTSSDPNLQKMNIDGKSVFGWPLDLQPGESMEINVVVNYRILAYIVIAIIVIIILYYLLRTPVVVSKSAAVLLTKEGGISELKILLHVRNRSTKQIKDLEVIDKAPHITDVVKEFDIGTLKPSKVLKHEKKGTLIKWKLDALDPREERVLKYKIRSRLSVIGEFKLPPCAVKFITPSGKERSSKSQPVTLMGQ